MDDLPEVIIIGAGIAGLSAALHLAERGLSPLVLEADPEHCGGRVAAKSVVTVDGWSFRSEHGVHAIWSPYRNLQAMLARHSLRPVLAPAQEERWYYKRGGRVRHADVGSAIRQSWIPAPFHYLNLFLRPGFLGLLTLRDWLSLPLVWYGLILSMGVDPLGEGQPLDGLWLSDLVKGWSLPLRALFIGLARNGLSARPEEIPLSGFIAFLRFYTLMRRDTWAFSYLPEDGGASLAEPLAAKAQQLGARIQMGTRVVRLEAEFAAQEEGRWHVCWERGEAAGSTAARQVILAVDAPNARAILSASPALAERVGGLHWPRGMETAVVRLWFDRSPEPGPEAGILSGDFILDNFFWLQRIQGQYLRWRRATGGSAIEGHIYGPPELLAESDAVLQRRAVADILSAFPELRGHVLYQTFQRNDPTHTLFSLGPEERHLGIATFWPGLFCCGDWVRHPAPAFFMERACLTGIEAANAVLRSRQMPPWPLLAAPPPEPLAGWIERIMHRGRSVLRRLASR